MDSVAHDLYQQLRPLSRSRRWPSTTSLDAGSRHKWRHASTPPAMALLVKGRSADATGWGRGGCARRTTSSPRSAGVNVKRRGRGPRRVELVPIQVVQQDPRGTRPLPSSSGGGSAGTRPHSTRPRQPRRRARGDHALDPVAAVALVSAYGVRVPLLLS